MRWVPVNALMVALLAASSCTRSGFQGHPCAGQDCSGHGTCGVTQSLEPHCACDRGYRNAGPLICTPDPDGGATTDSGSAAPDSATPEGGSDAGADADALAADVAVAEAGAHDLAVADGAADAGAVDSAPLPDAAVADSAPLPDAAVADSAPLPDAAAADSAPLPDAATTDSAAPDDAGALDCQLFHPVALPPGPASGEVSALWGAAADDLRAVTASGAIVHWDGCTMQTEYTVSSALKGIYGFAADDIWAAGEGDDVLRWSGAGWSPLPKPSSSDIEDVWGASADDVWFVGSPTGTSTFYVLRWSSAGGFTEPRTNNIDVLPYAVWGSAPDDVWIVGLYGIVTYDGNRFTQTEYVNYGDQWTAGWVAYFDVWGTGASDIDIVGRSWAWSQGSGSSWGAGGKRWNGVDYVTSWSFYPSQNTVYSVHGSSSADRWRVGVSRIVQHDQGGGWTGVTRCGEPLPSFVAVFAVAPDDVWFGAYGGGVYHYCGGASQDLDGDGYGAAICGGTDCNDCLGAVNPGAPEGPQLSMACSDGIDNDCDGAVDGSDDGCL